MKTSSKDYRSPWQRRESGIAIVVLLFVMVLIFGLIVAFLNSVKSERSSTAMFLASTEARQLAQTAVGLVQTQINAAATVSATNSGAWVSQPGMVRTYRENGAFDTAYKLYSANTLTTATSSEIGQVDLPPADWKSSPAVWTDLNEPAATASGTSVYPILDPNAFTNPTINKRVKGLSVSNVPGDPDSQTAPMPVRWLYVLKDGQIVAASGSGTTVTVASGSSSNPIVGRIAFWTDDDCSKINANTAGAASTTGTASYWDTPRFTSVEERNYGKSQPLNGEFQRYPGHPAMTSLWPVFPTLTGSQILTSITPRYQWGGSENGAVDTYSLTGALAGGTLANKPLFSSVDEIAFMPSYLKREQNDDVDRSMLEAGKFFITVNSRSPELNLLNLPRVACWPISTKATSQTLFDKVIAYCSSIKGISGLNPYYFSRQTALSGTTDAGIARNQQLYSYLQYVTAKNTPGFGVSLKDKFGTDDRDQILTEIWDYIRCANLYDVRLGSGNQFTTTPSTSTAGTPGFGYVVPLEYGTTKGFGRELTISEVAFHFICTADSVDTGTPQNAQGLLSSNGTNNLTLSGTLNPINKERRIQMMITPEFFFPSQGNVPVSPKYLQITISGLSSLKIGNDPLFDSGEDTRSFKIDTFNGQTHGRRFGGTVDYRALLAGATSPRTPDAYSGSTVYPFISKYVTVSATAAQPTMQFDPGNLTIKISASPNGTTYTEIQKLKVTTSTGAVGIPIPNLPITGGTDTTPQYWWAFSNNSPWKDIAGGGRLYGASGNTNSWNIMNTSSAPVSGSLIRGKCTGETANYTDIVRSVVPTHGDYRLVAALEDVPTGVFSPLGDWTASAVTSAANALIHTLQVGACDPHFVAGGSQYRRHYTTTSVIGGTSTSQGVGGQNAPDFRKDADSAIIAALGDSGDFDNGISFWPDGAYINKPDEGNLYSSAPYFDAQNFTAANSVGFFSPNRMMPGPGMFGSLPTHVKRYKDDIANPKNYAWRTLLFRKQPLHPNAVTSINGIPSQAPDHLLMDLFWMPTVEPYAISEPFASAGKINMNYEIQPFSYIVRKTALYGALANEKIAAVPNSDNGCYKNYASNNNNNPNSYRLPLDIEATLKQFDDRFTTAASNGRIFISPTELCDLWLPPTGVVSAGSSPTDTVMKNFWDTHKLTGDNTRERPYTNIIPRLTTKSNTYTVHFRVQTLKPMKPNQWVESRGYTAEYRGSMTIERFIDPNAAIPDYGDGSDPATKEALTSFYRWRVVENRQFCP